MLIIVIRICGRICWFLCGFLCSKNVVIIYGQICGVIYWLYTDFYADHNWIYWLHMQPHRLYFITLVILVILAWHEVVNKNIWHLISLWCWNNDNEQGFCKGDSPTLVTLLICLFFYTDFFCLSKILLPRLKSSTEKLSRWGQYYKGTVF